MISCCDLWDDAARVHVASFWVSFQALLSMHATAEVLLCREREIWKVPLTFHLSCSLPSAG